MKYYSANHLEPIEEVINDGISGSGSCFPAGTFVRTQHGYTPIETLKPNDIIIGYDRFGELEFGIIKQVFKHIGSDISHDLYDFHNGMPLVTGNHAIYDNITNEHKEAQDFNINESFTLMDGSQVIIDEISIQPKEEYSADFTVYNLEVLPMHTYLVSSDGIDWFKVHNGGGGKGGTPHVATEAADTLRSAAIARVLEVISEGEIEGIVGGPKGVYINNTPLQNTDNTYNFTNVVFDSRNGLPSQEKINWFPDAESEFQKDVTVTASTPVIQSITTSGVDFAKITLSLPNGLYVQNKTNGDVNGNTIAYKIDVRSTVGGTGSWQSVIDKSLTGKTMSNYEFTHRITAPAATWDVRVSRISADDPDTASQSDLKFARWTEIQSTTETYNNSAVAAISIPSESVGNQIPNRAYDVMGIKVQVPVNYDPITRVYSGSWNGLFKTAWTDNTAWILYDLITNTRYGIANYMNTPVAVDKWAFYDAAVYNDGLVPNGMGGYEVRYCFNNVIQTQEDAWQLLHAVASNMRANISMNSNLISIVQDRPTAATKILNNSNVLDGIFNYSTTDSSQRITAVNITFNDKDDHYLPRTISLVNTTSGASNTVDYNNGIEKWGYNVQDFTAYGSVTESFAKRLAKWVLYTEAKQEDIVSFGLALNSIDVGIGDVVKIMDNDYVTNTGTYLAGRVITAPTNLFGSNLVSTDTTMGGYTGWKIIGVSQDNPRKYLFNSSLSVLPNTYYSISCVYYSSNGAVDDFFLKFSDTGWPEGNVYCQPFTSHSITRGGNYTITDLGSNWKKLTAYFKTLPTTTTINQLFFDSDVAGQEVFVANIQLEAGQMASSYTTSSVVNVDSPIVIQAGYTYKVALTNLANDDIIERTITNTPGTYTTLTVDSIIPVGDYSSKEFYVYSNGLVEARSFKIINISELEKGKYNFTANFYDANKFSVIEQGLVVETPVYSNLTNDILAKPTNIQFFEHFSNNGINTNNYIRVTFDWSAAIEEAVTFSCLWRRDGLEYEALPTTSLKEFIIPDTTPGQYEVLIDVSNSMGKRSLQAYGTFDYKVSARSSTLEAPSNFYVRNTTGVTFTDPFLPLSWDYNTNNDNKTDRLLDYVIEVWTTNGLTKLNTIIVQPNVAKGGQYDYSFAQNKADYGSPSRSVLLKLFSRDAMGRLSVSSSKTFNNPAPSTTMTISNTINGAYLKAAIPSATDLVSYTFKKYSAASGGTLLETITTVNNYLDFVSTAGTTYYYTVTPNDTFGSGTETSRSAGTGISLNADTYTYNGLQFSTNESTNTVSWGSFTVYKNSETTPVTVNAGSYVWSTNTMYLYYIPGNTTLQQTTSSSTAVAAGGRILATYKGANNITADAGKAFIDGDQIIAGSLLTNALATNTAYITNMAQIGNIIESDNYSNSGGSYTGWRIDKDGAANFNSITIKDSAGNVTMASGGAVWDYISNPSGTKPANNATVGATWGTNISGQPSNDLILNNLQTGAWVVGQTPPWVLNGTSAENAIDYDTDVNGVKVPVWKCIANADGNEAGGWDRNQGDPSFGKNWFKVDKNKPYRFAVPVKITGGSTGSYYWGIGANTVCDLNTSNKNSNPYLVYGGRGDLVANRWYLLVGYVFPAGSTGNTNAGSGIFDLTTGELVAERWNYCWASDVEYTGTRAYQFYCANAGETQVFGYPTVEIVDGTESKLFDNLGYAALLNAQQKWSDVSGTGKPTDYANNTYVDTNGSIQGVSSGSGTVVNNAYLDTLTFNVTNMTVNGNTIKKTGGGHGVWNAQAYSKESYTLGAYASFSPDQTTAWCMAGLNTDPATNASYETLDHAWYMTGDGTLRIYESANDIGGYGTYSVGDILSITYDGTNIRYYQNGTLKRTVSVLIPSALYFDSSFHNENSSISKIKFGPMTSNAWNSIGGTGKPADYADVTNYNDTRVSNVIEENSTLFVARPIGASYNSNQGAVTGMIRIILPQGFTSTMMKFTVNVYTYSQDKSFSLNLAGYNHYNSGTWYNTEANLLGSTAADNRVRFGYDSTLGKCCIYIGEPTSSWSIPKVMVKDFIAGYSGFARSQWESGWAIDIVTSAPQNVTQDYADALIDAASIRNQGAFATLDKVTSSNASTYIADAAIGSAQIGSLSLTGNNFNVKSATTGARMEMDNNVIKVYDASNVLRVKLGNLSA